VISLEERGLIVARDCRWEGQREMKTIEVELPERVTIELETLVKDGWFSDEVEPEAGARGLWHRLRLEPASGFLELRLPQPHFVFDLLLLSTCRSRRA
jgi:hypothetical protein